MKTEFQQGYNKGYADGWNDSLRDDSGAKKLIEENKRLKQRIRELEQQPKPQAQGEVERVDMSDKSNPLLRGTIMRKAKITRQGAGEELTEYIERFIEKQKDNFSILGELQHMRVLLSKKSNNG